MLSTTDLIVAAATPSGAGARAIVRLAGDGLDSALAAICEVEPPGFATAGEPGRLVAARLTGTLARDWGAIPVEILHWPGPAGPVGGPLAEVQLPASAVLVADVVEEACRHGSRLARGGEFTLRAFLAGRLDLVQAEAVLGVVDAASPADLSAALDRMAAGSGGGLAAARGLLLDLVADIEAGIDFADETAPDAVPVGPDWSDVTSRITASDEAIQTVARRLGDRDVGAATLPRVVLVGPPNIGKSSLFNALIGREAALVADERGTTRDWLEAPLCDAAGPRCTLVDLPGLETEREAAAGTARWSDPLAAEASRRGREEVSRADVVVICHDAAGDPGAEQETRAAASATGRIHRLDVATRCDIATPRAGLPTSSITGLGLAAVREAILAAAAAVPPRHSPATTRLAVACESARQSLASASARAQKAADGSFVDESLVVAELRRAVAALAEVTGAAVDVDLLDRIFSRHCIGK